MSVDVRLKDLNRRLAEGDWDALPSYLAAEFFSYTPGPDEPSAAERFASIVSDLHAAMPDLTATLSDVTPNGDIYTATLTVDGTHENALWGAPGLGAHITWVNPVSIKPIGDRFAVSFDDIAFPELIAVLRRFGLVNPPDEMDRPPPYWVSLPEFLMKVVFTGRADDKPCAHLNEIRVVEPDTRVCAVCFSQGDTWPALRLCLICGFVGCCDTSKNKHMLRHFEETGHPIMRSIRMDEGWVWCYEDNAFFETAVLERYR